jgi:hypothetical protein
MERAAAIARTRLAACLWRGLRNLISIATIAASMVPGVCIAQSDEQAAGQTVDEDFASQETPPADSDNSLVGAMNLQTGDPLRVVISPFHWGHLSLVSASVYQGYDSNPNLQPVADGSRLQAFSALAVYEKKFTRSLVDAQYHPFILASTTRTLKDLGAASFDFITGHPLSQSWNWRAADHTRYSPSQQATVEGRGFVFDTGGGLTIGNAFLSSGRNFLENTVALTLRDQYTQGAFLDVHVDQRFARLSGPLGQSTTDPGSQEEFRTGGGVTWSDTLSTRNTIDVKYDYSVQSVRGTDTGGVRSHNLGIGWNHHLTPSVSFTAEIGPIWSTVAQSQQQTTARLHGAVQLLKSFHDGGVAVAFSRSDNFSGMISNSVNNRYDFSLERRLGVRWSLLSTASYIQQESVGRHTTTGALAAIGFGYSLSRNWTLFTQGRYLDVIPTAAPEKIATIGVTWSWEPDKP